jgi:hypothetical protein
LVARRAARRRFRFGVVLSPFPASHNFRARSILATGTAGGMGGAEDGGQRAEGREREPVVDIQGNLWWPIFGASPARNRRSSDETASRAFQLSERRSRYLSLHPSVFQHAQRNVLESHDATCRLREASLWRRFPDERLR